MITFGTVLTPAEPLNLSAKRLSLDKSPNLLFERFLEEYEVAYLLESARGKSKLAEYSFIGFEPSTLVHSKDGYLEVEDVRSGSKDGLHVLDPLVEIKRLVPPNSVSGLFRFIGGAVGYLSYDAVRHWERIPSRAADDLGYPDLQFGIYEDGVVFDHARGEVYYFTLGKDRSEEVLRVAGKAAGGSELRTSEKRPNVRQQDFEGMVERAKEYIAKGDAFQVVLSKRFDFEVDGDLSRFYRSLSKVNPSPYMYFLKFGQRSIVGSSPEMLARVEDGRIETYPIAGTRPVLPDNFQNAKLARELVEDPKEKAEHVMLVDLARNDLGRVAEYGSVNVPEFLTVEKFSHVQHMVSHVTGHLRDGVDSYDALRAVFPAGTVSGAPKVRAMEIIDELEPHRRGPYAGAVGYFSFNGNSDFAITIRTLVSEGRRCSIQAGAGVVADSSPEKEWEETEAKARGLFKALELAEGRRP